MRGRIDWKYSLGLELTNAGFDHTVLSEFRTRLVEGELELICSIPCPNVRRRLDC